SIPTLPRKRGREPVAFHIKLNFLPDCILEPTMTTTDRQNWVEYYILVGAVADGVTGGRRSRARPSARRDRSIRPGASGAARSAQNRRGRAPGPGFRRQSAAVL